jgi:hypothetical protein
MDIVRQANKIKGRDLHFFITDPNKAGRGRGYYYKRSDYRVKGAVGKNSFSKYSLVTDYRKGHKIGGTNVKSHLTDNRNELLIAKKIKSRDITKLTTTDYRHPLQERKTALKVAKAEQKSLDLIREKNNIRKKYLEKEKKHKSKYKSTKSKFK